MKVVVTGGAGYMGSVLSGFLLAAGHEITIFDSLMYGGRSLLGLYPYDKFSFVCGDIRDKNHLEETLRGVDAVVHLAAIVGDPACAKNPTLSRQVNFDSSLELFSACERADIDRFIFASTCSNYGMMLDPRSSVTEEADLNPVSLYAETKVATERALLDIGSQDSVSVTIGRFATLFGLSPRMRFDLTVNEFTAELLMKGKVSIYGQQFWRPYVHVRDAARAICLFLEAPRSQVASQVFNVGDNSQNYQKGALVELIRSCVGRTVDIEYVEKKEDPRDYRVAFDKINTALGFKITRSVTDGIMEIVHAIEQGAMVDTEDPQYRN